MKKYHMQVQYTNEWFEEINHIGSTRTDKLLDWTNIEEAPDFEAMERKCTEVGKHFVQNIRMISDDGEAFYIGFNGQNNYPHKINHLHKTKF